MLDKALVALVIALAGLAALPWLLWRVWVNRIPFKKQGRRPDFDLRASKPVG